jgi:hypothetical protein
MAKKTPLPDVQSCASCRCYSADPGDDAGYCKRYPPTLIVLEESITSAYPVVGPTDICGEYARRLQS